MTDIVPTQIKLLQKLRVVQLTFSNGKAFELSCYDLRIASPSAEMRGHGNKVPDMTSIAADVNVVSIQPVGQYAVKFIFDDDHQTGIYNWPYLYELAEKYGKVIRSSDDSL
jgi:DUF971 family protein